MSLTLRNQNQMVAALAKSLAKVVLTKGGRALKKKFRRRGKARGPRRKFRGANTLRLGSARGKAFLPRTALVSHNWSESFSMDGSDMSNHVKQLRLNDIYDPGHSLSSIQPFGSDQMRAMYQRYTVVGVSWKCIFHNAGASSSGIAQNARCYALIGRTDATGGQETVPDSANEFYMEGWSGGGYIKNVYSGGPTVIKGTWSAKKQFKEYVDDDDIIRDTNIGAAQNASPTTLALLTFGSFRNDNGDPLAITVRVILRYHVLWHDPKTLGLS